MKSCIKFPILFFTLSLTFLFLFCRPAQAQNQTKVDSLLDLLPTKDDTTHIKIYKALADEYESKDQEKYKAYLDKQIEYSRSSGIGRFIMESLYTEGVYYHNIGDLPLAQKKFNEALEYLDPKKDGERLAKLYFALSNNAAEQGYYQSAIKKAQQSIDLMIEFKVDSVLMADNYRVLGNIHGIIENWELSDEYYRKAIEVLKKNDRPVEMMVDSMSIGINLIQQSQYEKAKPIMEAAMSVFEENASVFYFIYSCSNLGNIEQQLGNMDRAEAIYKKGLTVAEEQEALSEYVTMSTRLADIYNDTGRDRKSIPMLQEVEEINGKYGDAYMQVVIYGQLEESYNNLNNYKAAYNYLQKYSQLNDSLMSVENLATINELEIKYQTEKKEQELIIEKDRVGLLQKEAKVSSLQRWLLASSLFLTLASLLFIWYSLRQKNKLAIKEKERVDAELEFKKKELTTHALHLAKKNELLEGLKNKAQALRNESEGKNGYRQLIRTIDFNLNDDHNWDNFASYFQQVHKDFNQNVVQKYPEVTPNELRLISLVKMNLSIKEMANILNISVAGVKKARQRLRKKMNLNTKDSLERAVLEI